MAGASLDQLLPPKASDASHVNIKCPMTGERRKGLMSSIHFIWCPRLSAIWSGSLQRSTVGSKVDDISSWTFSTVLSPEKEEENPAAARRDEHAAGWSTNTSRAIRHDEVRLRDTALAVFTSVWFTGAAMQPLQSW